MKAINPKYWLLTTEYPPFHGGGISTYSYHTSLMLSENGYAVTVFILDNTINETAIEVINKNLTLIRFNAKKKQISKYLSDQGNINYRFLEITLQQIEKDGAPEYIEAQDYLGIAYYILSAKYALNPLLKNVSVIITLHSPAFLYLPFNKISIYKIPELGICEMEKHSIIAADILISPSVFIKNRISEELSIESDKIHVIKNPFPVTNRKIPEFYNKNTLTYLGKLSRQKGSFFLFESMKTIWDAGSDLTLTTIGDREIVYHQEGKTMNEIIQAKYKKYIIEKKIVLKDKINSIRLNENKFEDSFIVFPSLIDNLPYVVIEMMSLGKIIIASKNGGQSEIISHNKNGFLFDLHTDNFSNVLREVMLTSEESLKKISASAIQYITENFSYKKIFSAKDNLLKSYSHENKQKAIIDLFPFRYQEKIFYTKQKSTKGLLSVIIPYYNLGKNLYNAIESIKKSNYKNIEIIIINDGSSDTESLKILDQIKLRYPEIIIENQVNKGLATARNNGALKAKGEFLSFLDADDKISTSYYEKAIAILNKYQNVFFVGAWVEYFNKSKEIWPSFTPQPPYILVHNTVNSSSLVYKKDAFIYGGLNNVYLEKGFEDYESILHLLSNGLNGVVIPEIHYYYQVRTKSMFRKMTKTNKINAYEYILDQNIALYRKHYPEVINILNANGPGFNYETPEYELGIKARIIRIFKRNALVKTLINPLFIKKNYLLKIYRFLYR